MLKRFIGFLALLLAVIIPLAARAQALPQIDAVAVSLWPAYDRPGVLVIYHITLASTSKLPLEMTFRIPKEVGQPFAVASKETNGQLLTIQYTLGESGSWITVHFTAAQPELQIEYYDPRLITKEQDHSFTYTWAGDYDIASMIVEIQQPYGASNMQISPGNASARSGGDGLTYFIKEVGRVSANEQFSLDVSYIKASSKLSVEDLQIQPSAPLSASTTLGDSLRNALPWILGVIGLAVIAGGGFWYWQSGRQTVQAPRKRRRSPRPRPEKATISAEGAIYCHQCGKRASSSDRFCRSCGTRLRLEG